MVINVFLRVLTLGEVFSDGWRHVQSHSRLDIRHLTSKHFVQQEAKLPYSCLCAKEIVMGVVFWRAVVLSAYKSKQLKQICVSSEKENA